jgi:hypothetical protein
VGCPFFLVRTRRGPRRPARPLSVLPMHARRPVHSLGITRRPSRREDPRALSAGVAQLAEHLFCKQVVGGSSPPASSTLNLGGLPERPKGAGCKPAGIAYVGSNPTPSTRSVFSQAGASACLLRAERSGLVFVSGVAGRDASRLSRPVGTPRRSRRFVVRVGALVADVDLAFQDFNVVSGEACASPINVNATGLSRKVSGPTVRANAPAAPTNTARSTAPVANEARGAARGAVAPAATTNAAARGAVAPAAPTNTALIAAKVAGGWGRGNGSARFGSPSRSYFAGVAQLVEHQPSKLNVEGSNPFSRSTARGALGAEVGWIARPHSSVGRARPW